MGMENYTAEDDSGIPRFQEADERMTYTDKEYTWLEKNVCQSCERYVEKYTRATLDSPEERDFCEREEECLICQEQIEQIREGGEENV